MANFSIVAWLKGLIFEIADSTYSIEKSRLSQVAIEIPKDPKYGELSTNAAMVIASHLRQAPHSIAKALTERLQPVKGFSSISVAENGFINFIFDNKIWEEVLYAILSSGENYGSNDSGRGKKVNIRYVAANLTSPFHIGDVRGIVYGDTLARVMEYSGFEVTREYYINEADNQVKILAKTAFLLYKEATVANEVEHPKSYCPGDYLIAISKKLAELYQDELLNLSLEKSIVIAEKITLEIMLEEIKTDLYALSTSYFADYIFYAVDQINCSFDHNIIVFGTDQAGCIEGLAATYNNLGDDNVELEVKLCQIINLKVDGQPLKMLKQAENFTTIKDIIEKVGVDVIRFVMLMKRNDVILAFDLDLLKEQSKDNAAFYVQYSQARAVFVLNNCRLHFKEAYELYEQGKYDLSLLKAKAEVDLVRHLALWPSIVESSAATGELHRLIHYLQEAATRFHNFWNMDKGDEDLRFIVYGNVELTAARMTLVTAVKSIIREGLNLVGIKPLEKM